MYREGLVRFATEKYNNKDEGSVYAHLTNYSINKKNENYVQNEDAGDDDSGFKWSFSAMQQHFKEAGIDVNLMWSKIYDVVIKSLLSIEDMTKTQIKKSNIGRNNCYELFGYDILLDNYMNPWLLEINLSPSLAFDSPLDLKIKANLIKDTFNLIGLVMPQHRHLYNAPSQPKKSS
jgi:tubulin polyglutamylase TTLL5